MLSTTPMRRQAVNLIQVLQSDLGESPVPGGAPPTLVYNILLIISLVFFVLFAWDAMINENEYQLFTFLFFSILVTLYAFFSMVLRFGDSSDLSPAVPIIMFAIFFVGEFVLFFVGYQVYHTFGWRVFTKIGADPNKRTMYRMYLILMTLIKLDTGIALVLIGQYTSLILKIDDAEFYLNILAVFVIAGYIFVIYYAVRKESLLLFYIFAFLSILEPSYIIFKLVRFATSPVLEVASGSGSTALLVESGTLLSSYPLLVASAGTALIVRCVVIYYSIRCYQNFGKGLRGVFEATNGDDGADNNASGLNSLGSFNHSRKLTMDNE